eukprot:4670731-Amphidinium_carterae.1
MLEMTKKLPSTNITAGLVLEAQQPSNIAHAYSLQVEVCPMQDNTTRHIEVINKNHKPSEQHPLTLLGEDST